MTTLAAAHQTITATGHTMPTSHARQSTGLVTAKFNSACALLAFVLASQHAPVQAQGFLPEGAKGTLTVEYSIESSGKRPKNNFYDSYEWQTKDKLTLVADLVVQKPSVAPGMRANDNAVKDAMAKKGEQAQAMSKQAAPMMASVEQLVAKCAGDEACMTREVMKMGNAMAGTPQMATMEKLRGDTAELAKMGPPRYQLVQQHGLKGTYSIDESVKLIDNDPICMEKPGGRCHRTEKRVGSGDVPIPAAVAKNANMSLVEYDDTAKLLAVRMLVPMAALPMDETVVTTQPASTAGAGANKGPQKRERWMRLTAEGQGNTNDKFLSIPVKGGWRSQSGEYTETLKGDPSNGDKLVVRWKLVLQ
jgi:hypothetical protein